LRYEDFLQARLHALLRYAAILTGDPHQAEDVVQEVLVRASRRWRAISRMDAPEAYLKRMITNEYLSWRRRRSSTEVATGHDVLASLAGASADHATACDDLDALRAGVALLPRKQRAALTLRYYEDLSYAEIGAHLGCSEGTARSHVSRALTALRVDLAPAKEPR